MSTRDSLRAALIAATNPAPVKAVVPGLGDVFLKVQTIATGERNRARLDELRKNDGLDTARALAFVLCDEEGNYLFDIDNHDDVSYLGALTPDVVAAIFKEGAAVNRLRPEDKEGKDPT